MRHPLKLAIASCYALLLTTAFQCGEDHEPAPAYTFKEAVALYPAQKSYHMGDTIWLAYQNASNTLVDQRTNQPIGVDTVSVPFAVTYQSRHSTPVSPAGGFCEFVTATGSRVTGQASQPNPGIFLELGCAPPRGHGFKVGVVLKTKGVYSLDLPAIPRDVRACPTRRRAFPRSAIEYRFAVADGNRDVYLAIPPHQRGESVKGDTERRIEEKLVFMLKVE